MRRLKFMRNYMLFVIALIVINFTCGCVALEYYFDFIGLCFIVLTSVCCVDLVESVEYYIATYKYLKTKRARRHRQVMLESKAYRRYAVVLESEALCHIDS